MRCVLLALVSMLAAALVAAAGATPAVAASFTVTSTADAGDDAPGDGLCRTAPGGPCTLRAAIGEATGNGNAVDDTIAVPAGDYALTLGELIVTGAGGVDIVGAGAAQTAIRQTGVARVLHATAPGGPLRLSGLTVRGGRVPPSDFSGSGGGIRSVVGLELDDVVVYDNQVLGGGPPATGIGGGVYATGDQVTIRRSTIARNQAPSQGGGLYIHADDVLVETALIARNVVTGGSGGGLSVTAGGGVGHEGRIAATTISGNAASGPGGQGGGLAGGGIDSTPFVLERSLVVGNSAGAAAGGWILGGSRLGNADNTTFSANTAGLAYGAGAIEKQNGTGVLTLRHVTASGNRNVEGARTITAGGAGSVRMRATIVDGDCLSATGGIVDLGGNLSTTTSCGLSSGAGANVQLDPLTGNGGPTWTHAIAATSPANSRVPSGCLPTDQRGAARAAVCDTGAYERGPSAPAGFDVPPPLPDADGDGMEDLDDPCPAAAGPAPGGCPPPGTPAGCPAVGCPASPGGDAGASLAAAIRVRRASTANGRLSVAGSIARSARGSIALRLTGAGRAVRLRVPVRAGRFRAVRSLGRLRRQLRTGSLVLSYAGSNRVRPGRVRLRAGIRPAALRLTSASRAPSGRLRLAGTVSRHARGRVLIRVEPRSGASFAPVTIRARIARGRWSVNRPLRVAAAGAGLQVGVLYAGNPARLIWGERTGRAL